MDYKKFSKLVMIEQTLFALPFAYIGMLFAGGGKISHWIWVTIALFAARTAGMAFNRVLDEEYDRRNPRTSKRLLPSGEVTRGSVWALGIGSSVLLVVSAFFLNSLCFYLSFVAVLLLFSYSLLKRFSSTSHFYLGLVEAAAPVGGYIAVSGEFDPALLVPGFAIMFWIAGLDIIYSIQDMDFDLREGLFSIPARFGRSRAITISLVCYVLALAALACGPFFVKTGTGYWVGWIIIAIIFIRQQNLARSDSDEYEASVTEIFDLNRFISPAFFTGMLVDFIIRTFDIVIY